MAVRGGDVTGVIFHTDRGSEYTAGDFAKVCERFGITQSMGRVGSALDNAASESFFSTLEFECLRKHHFETKAQARRVVANWIDGFYNQVRRHGSCEGRSPSTTSLLLTAAEPLVPHYRAEAGRIVPIERDDTATNPLRGVRAVLHARPPALRCSTSSRAASLTRPAGTHPAAARQTHHRLRVRQLRRAGPGRPVLPRLPDLHATRRARRPLPPLRRTCRPPRHHQRRSALKNRSPTVSAHYRYLQAKPPRFGGKPKSPFWWGGGAGSFGSGWRVGMGV